eukprot:8600548-Alexandrium_andersonii.AAC.1
MRAAWGRWRCACTADPRPWRCAWRDACLAAWQCSSRIRPARRRCPVIAHRATAGAGRRSLR